MLWNGACEGSTLTAEIGEEGMTRVGFVGLGRMGMSMAGRLSDAGHQVVGVDTSPIAAQRAIERGIEVVDDVYGMRARVVFSSLPDTAAMEEVYLGGLFDRLEAGALFMDLSTVDVAATRRIAQAAASHGHRFLDCPVSGTSIHARDGELAIMVGGEAAVVEEARPYLEVLGRSVHHMGPNGAGLEMKLITNRLLTAHLVAIAEAIVEMREAGLDPPQGVEMLARGAVPRLLDYKAAPMIVRDHTPMFTVDLMVKDLDLAQRRRPAGPVCGEAEATMRRAQAEGWGESDISAVIEIVGEGTDPGSGGLDPQ